MHHHQHKGLTQQVLVGETLYLRAMRIEDAACSAAWRPSPFPYSQSRATEWLEKEIPKDWERHITRLVACRRETDEVVGYAEISFDEDWPSVPVLIASAPVLREAGEAVRIEIMQVLVPYLIGERGVMAATVTVGSEEHASLEAARAIGMRDAYRIREGLRTADGGRQDWVTLQILGPFWMEKLGDPGAGILAAGEPQRDPKSATPLVWPASELPMPKNALIASPRIALRPMEKEDAAAIAPTFLAEPESYGHTRMPFSPLLLSQYWHDLSEHTPSNEVEFAVVLRETGEVIGDVGLYFIDWDNRTAESGSWIYRPEHRGGGLGTEAKQLLFEWAFNHLDIHVIWSWVMTPNERSATALIKQGYRTAGRMDWVGLGPDGPRSFFIYDLTAEEWRAARR